MRTNAEKARRKGGRELKKKGELLIDTAFKQKHALTSLSQGHGFRVLNCAARTEDNMVRWAGQMGPEDQPVQ